MKSCFESWQRLWLATAYPSHASEKREVGAMGYASLYPNWLDEISCRQQQGWQQRATLGRQLLDKMMQPTVSSDVVAAAQRVQCMEQDRVGQLALFLESRDGVARRLSMFVQCRDSVEQALPEPLTVQLTDPKACGDCRPGGPRDGGRQKRQQKLQHPDRSSDCSTCKKQYDDTECTTG